MQIDLSDKKIYDLIQRSDNKTIQTDNNQNKQDQEEQQEQQKQQYLYNQPDQEDQQFNIVKICKKQGSLFKFVKNLFLIILCLFLIYITIFRYIMGYNFFKN